MLLDEKGRLAIGDFGIARLGLEDQITQTGQVLGTAAYISPEQAMGEPATAGSDRYALAVVAFELLTGSKPFSADNFAAQARSHVEDEPPLASERDIDVPPAADRVLDRGMAKDARGPLGDRRRDGARARRRARRAAPAPPRRGRRRDARDGADRPARRGTHAASGPWRRSRRPPQRRHGPDRRRAPRRFGAGAVIALAALMLVVAGAIALMSSGDGGDDPDTTAQREPTATADARPDARGHPGGDGRVDPHRGADRRGDARATSEAPAPPEQKPKKVKNDVPGNDPAALQLQAYKLNSAGDHQQALAFAQKAVELCGGSGDVSPAPTRSTSTPGRCASPATRRRRSPRWRSARQRFPDNQPGAVEQELALAREAAGQSD